MAEGVVNICLPCASRPMQEEDLPRPIADCRGDPLKCSRLILVESCNVLSSFLSQSRSVVLPLLHNEPIPKHLLPVALNMRHAGPVLKPLSSLRKELVNQEEAIVLNLCICGLCNPCMMLKAILEIITDVRPKVSHSPLGSAGVQSRNMVTNRRRSCEPTCMCLASSKH